MTEDPYHPEPPFEYECIECGSRFEADDVAEFEPDDELIACPECDGDLRNVTIPSRE